jgi:hypothetical protein
MKGRMKRGTGGVNEAKEDEDTKPESRTNSKKIDAEAEEKAAGGAVKRATGGRAARASGGKIGGEKKMMHAGHKPRKNGGRTGSDSSPFTSARYGSAPSGRNEMSESED